MKTAISTFIGFLCLTFFLSGCQTAQKIETNSTNTIVVSSSPAPKTETAETFPIIDVPKLANKSIAEIEGILGQPIESKPIKDPNPGEYRVYQIANHEKGLAVRFYGGKAKNFNLILSKPFSNSKEALLKGFGIDVGSAPPKIDPNEPLSEKWFGTFNGVKFAVAYAKKQRPETSEFIFVLAEIN